MDIFEMVLEHIAPVLFFIIPLLIPILIVMRIFKYKDVIVEMMDQARKNPDYYKNNPEAARQLMMRLRLGGNKASKEIWDKKQEEKHQRALEEARQRIRRGQEVEEHMAGGVRDRDDRDDEEREFDLFHSAARKRRQQEMYKYSKARVDPKKMRKDSKIKTTAGIFLLGGGVILLGAAFYEQMQIETFWVAILVVVAGLYLLKSDPERL